MEEKETKIEVKEPSINKLVKDVRELAEKKEKDVIEKEKEAKLDARLNELEKSNQELVKKLAIEEKSKQKLQEDFDIFVKQATRLPAGKGEKKDELREEYQKSFRDFIQKKISKEDMLHKSREFISKKGYSVDFNTAGGFLVSPEFSTDIIKKITEISPIRSLARVKTITGISTYQRRRETLISAYWVGERQETTKSNSTYGMREIKAHKLGATADVTLELLLGADFDMKQEVSADVAESFALAEGIAFTTGDGVNKPFGFMSDADVGVVNSGNASALTGDGIIDLATALKTGYNGMYLLNRATLGVIRKLKDTQARYLWIPTGDLSAGKPNQINGYPYMEIPAMADVAANAFPVAFADLQRGYQIVDRQLMFMAETDNKLVSEGSQEYVFFRMVGGLTVLPEAIKKQKVAA